MSTYWTHRPNQAQALFIQPCYEEIVAHALTTSITSLVSTNRTAASASCSSLRRWTTPFALSWRRSDERKVHLDRLIQQLSIMCSINRSSSLIQCWVFDQRIALEHHSLALSIMTRGSGVENISCAKYLDITRPAIQIQMQILDFTKVRKLVVQVLLASLLVHVCGDDDPALDRADCGRVGVGGH